MARLPNQCIYCRYFFANQPLETQAKMLRRNIKCSKKEDVFAGRFCPSFKQKPDYRPVRL